LCRYVLEKYGNAAAAEPAPEGLLLGQTENYVEYDRAGRVVKGAEKVIVKSRYDEVGPLFPHHLLLPRHRCHPVQLSQHVENVCSA
jgi:hypothetical protein